MPFDPDKFIAARSKPAFDPDAFIAARTRTRTQPAPQPPQPAPQPPQPRPEVPRPVAATAPVARQPVQPNEQRKFMPQLLNPISELEAEPYIRRGWILQEKFDGKRFMVCKIGGSVYGLNKLGSVIPVPPRIVATAESIDGDFVVDGELVSGEYTA